MKIYTAPNGPNPAALRAIVKIKDIDIEQHEIDMNAGENRGDAFLKINPAGQLPCLQLDDGTVIAEVAAIAEYLEEIKPDPVLVGSTAGERAFTRMRMRQVDYLILGPSMTGFRQTEGREFFKNRMTMYDGYGEPAKMHAAEGLAWLDKQMEGCTYICGDRLTYVDCCFYPVVNMMSKVGQPIDEALTNITAYMARLKEHEIIGSTR